MDNKQLTEYPKLLAVDLGLRCGIAVFNHEGRLLSYRSTNFGSIRRLRAAVWNILVQVDSLAYLILEGDRQLAEIWNRAAVKMDVTVLHISAETWRPSLLLQRQQRSGLDAKAAADDYARELIQQSNAPKPTSLRHDAAEAILIGLWGVMHVGWRSRPLDA